MCGFSSLFLSLPYYATIAVITYLQREQNSIEVCLVHQLVTWSHAQSSSAKCKVHPAVCNITCMPQTVQFKKSPMARKFFKLWKPTRGEGQFLPTANSPLKRGSETIKFMDFLKPAKSEAHCTLHRMPLVIGQQSTVSLRSNLVILAIVVQ